MSVYSRIQQGREGEGGWSADRFAAAVGELADGGPFTKAQMYARLGATALEQAQMDQMAAVYQALNAVGQAKYLNRVRNAVKLVAHGDYTESQLNARLGITTAA